MRTKKLPEAEELFMEYASCRDVGELAGCYGVSRQAIHKIMVRERWKERVAEIDRRARQTTDAKIVESIAAMDERHLKMIQFLQGRALETLRATPLASARDAARVLVEAVKVERLVRGEPTERAESESSVEAIIKRETERWLRVVVEDQDANEGSQSGEADGVVSEVSDGNGAGDA